MSETAPFRIQAFRFAMVGLASNALLYLIYLALTAAGIDPKIAMSLLYMAGVAQTFLFNKRWTFNHTGNHSTTLVRYLIVYASGYLVNLLVLFWLVDSLGYPHQIIQGVMILMLAGTIFLLQKFWVFKVP